MHGVPNKAQRVFALDICVRIRHASTLRAKTQDWTLAQSPLTHLKDSASILRAFSLALSPHSAESRVPLSMTASKEPDVQSDKSLQHANVRAQEMPRPIQLASCLFAQGHVPKGNLAAEHCDGRWTGEGCLPAGCDRTAKSGGATLTHLPLLKRTVPARLV